MQVQLEEDTVSPVGERDVRRLWVALALGPGLGYSHLDLVVGDRLKLVIEDLDVDIGLIAAAVDSTDQYIAVPNQEKLMKVH